ncbi:4-phosphopantetheinyl transferase family protein [Pedobacter frigidisoli]|uniref:4-phosphopantetheinyl transferase family protein n=1 Tax=Pedobacter frigidisoli TaxID=2530455 RepID=A0A4R0P0J2_9SPHI|nr:4'-phosphopantetheinyl transferase superfamily protein [Pedobacter frigidisoli]TCD10197.1 4-phosphopantetheinyl transferase family protein [Pedobacter frigidisoli]
MVGNDIVDLQLAKVQSNWQRKGYLEKVFNENERLLISSAENPDVIVWLLWSMKEAAYKIHNRVNGIREYAPKKLNCFIVPKVDLTRGRVNIDGAVYFTKSSINSAYLHTISSSIQHQIDAIKISIYEFPNHPSKYKDKNPGCISHHGKYLALAY